MENHGILIQNKYRLLKKIGEGNYSRVYYGHHVTKDQYVAIKIDKECEISKKLLKHEIDVYLHLMKHKMTNISSFKSFGIYGQSQYIIMQYLNMDLKTYVEKNRDFITMDTVNNLMMQCFRLLKHMHKTGLVHRDIKPENFMFDKNKNLCIIDFGLSSTFDEEALLSKCIGTPFYSSYKTHKNSYSYRKEDDFISVYYVFFHLFGKKLPWENLCIDRHESKNIIYYHIKKHTDFMKFYKDNEICLNIVKSYNFFKYYNEFKFYS
jgi:serine/threonine protein kinase